MAEHEGSPRGAGEAAREASAGVPGATVQLTFVVVSLALVLLLVLPIAVRQRSDAIRETATEVAEPARDLAQDIERDLAVQVAASRGYALDHDPGMLVRFRAAAQNSENAFRRLAAPASLLGPDVAANVIRFHGSMTAWQHESWAEQPAQPATPARTALQQRLFEATIADAAHVDTAIGVAVQRRREEARRIDVVAAIITSILVLLVLASVVLLARLAQQLRRLAEQSRVRAREEELLRRELEATMESRARLIRGFSHDVRNPLGAADGYAQLLENGVYGELSEQQRASLTRIRRSIRSAVVLTDDLLDLARLEAGQLQMERAIVNVCAVAAETAEEYRAQAEAAGLTVELDCPDELRVDSDGRRIHQVLGNLLSNAIKYTPAGGRVHVRVAAGPGPGQRTQPGAGERAQAGAGERAQAGAGERAQAGAGERAGGRPASGSPRSAGWVALAVSDTGIGIAPEQRARIFDEFARAQAGAAPGAGLGLTISRRLARALGGAITLESEPGRGSTFTLWLPAE